MSKEEIGNNSAKEAPTLGIAECKMDLEMIVKGSRLSSLHIKGFIGQVGH